MIPTYEKCLDSVARPMLTAEAAAALIDLLIRGEVLRGVCMTPEDKPDRDRDLWDAAAAKARKLLGVE